MHVSWEPIARLTSLTLECHSLDHYLAAAADTCSTSHQHDHIHRACDDPANALDITCLLPWTPAGLLFASSDISYCIIRLQKSHGGSPVQAELRC